MKLSNFKFLSITLKGDMGVDSYNIAEVDCTEGHLFWKKTVTRKIRLDYNKSVNWYFVDNGHWCSDELHAMYRSWEANHT